MIFDIDMNDCKMIVKTDRATCYVMGTCCKNFTPEKKAEIDNKLIEIALKAIIRKKIAASNRTDSNRTEEEE